MLHYAALLRGINVGKHKRIAMADLRSLIESLGYSGVQTLLNSGNIAFNADEATNAGIASRIEGAIADEFGMDVPVIVRSGAELQRIVDRNPFPERASDHKTLHVEFLETPLSTTAISAMESLDKGEDDWHLEGDTLYLAYPNKLTGATFRPNLDVQHTSRNWQTVIKLARLTAD